MTLDLFADSPERLGPHAWLLRGMALPYVDELLPAIDRISAAAPFRRMSTPGGKPMSVLLSNCGELGWCSDRRGYRYERYDPVSHQPWPAMPTAFLALARASAEQAGFANFQPDACLINRYLPGSGMGLHQDRDEHDFSAPIVSVSLGMTATFLFGGLKRSDTTVKVPLYHGDVVVWGGEDRLRFHGIKPINDNPHALLGSQRINLTFRRAG